MLRTGPVSRVRHLHRHECEWTLNGFTPICACLLLYTNQTPNGKLGGFTSLPIHAYWSIQIRCPTGRSSDIRSLCPLRTTPRTTAPTCQHRSDRATKTASARGEGHCGPQGAQDGAGDRGGERPSGRARRIPEPPSPPYHTQTPCPDLPASLGPRKTVQGGSHCGPQGEPGGAGRGGRDPQVARVDFRVTATSTYILPHLG